MSKIILTEQSSAASTPSSGKVAVYCHTDGKLRSVDDAGAVSIYTTVFGTEFYEYDSDGEDSTTSTSYQTKLTGSPTLTTGQTYRIGFSAKGRSTGVCRPDFEFSINGDKTWTYTKNLVADGDPDMIGGFHYYSPGSTGAKTLTIKYKCAVASGTTYISEAKIEVWRVS